MNSAQTNTLTPIASWSSYAAATCTAEEAQLEQPEVVPSVVPGWPRPIALFEPTVQEVEWIERSSGGSASVTYCIGQLGRRTYRIVELVGGPLSRHAHNAEDDVPVFSFAPLARTVVRAKVTVKSGSLRLIIPDVLLDEE